MATPKVAHALIVEPGAEMVPGRFYQTMCGTAWEHKNTLPSHLRTRYVCALCHERQLAALQAALEEYRTQYNTHLTKLHPKEG